MKYSVKRVAATLCVAATLFAVGAPALAETNKVAVFHLDGPLMERPMGDFGFSFGNQPESLKSLLERFYKAGKDDSIRAILITVGAPGLGMAQVEELRQAMQDCGKPVYVHVDSLNTGLYTLVSAAKHVSITPTGDVWLLGFYTEGLYLRDMLGKINVEPDIVHIGNFKSAGETFSRNGPSEPAEANMNWLLDGLFDGMVKNIADSRYNGNVDKVKSIIDNAPYTAEKALELGIVDSVQHRQDLVAELKKKFGDDLKFVRGFGKDSGPDVDFGNPFAFFQVIADLMAGEKESTSPSIAIIYVDGGISTGSDQTSPFGGSSGAKSTSIRKALDAATADDSVKAVVLRVSSPGGSALASEIIYDATLRVKAAGKPFVVSMGNVAASGGYYVSCAADKIIADPMTITASIGVVGGKIVTTGMWDSMGIHWHPYQRGKQAAIMSTARAWNDDERKRIIGWMDEVYGIFKGHIVEHRGSKLTKPIDEMAGGRVFTGTQALELGLVDQLGSMKDAIESAADLASLGDYELKVLPRTKNIFEIFGDQMGGRESDNVQVSFSRQQGLFASGSPLMDLVMPLLQTLDPQRSAALGNAMMKLQIMHEENIVLMPAGDWVIHFK
ncbi:MAG: signal peptide peptidase SppA [Planctomycetes bacterium]|nr:signal peptide peptidase SppA [Planctomycetota bacterium]